MKDAKDGTAKAVAAAATATSWKLCCTASSRCEEVRVALLAELPTKVQQQEEEERKK